MIKTKNKLFLAPLDNVNCASFRLLCKEFGAGLVSTEMINTNAFINNRENFYWYKEEKPLLVQFIGHEPNEFKECVKDLKNCSVVDLNAGCPSSDQVKTGNGAALLKDLPLMRKILQTMIKYSPVPVSAKIRMGYTKNESLKILEKIDDLGLDFITIHPRLQSQGYGVPADWKVIKKMKEKAKTLIVASGDLTSPEQAKYCFEQTNCDAVMFARGAINDPFIFNDTIEYMKTGELIEHSDKERLNMILHFIELYNKYDKKNYNLSELRNHCIWLVKGVEGARSLRDKIGKAKSEERIKELLI